MYTYLFFHIHRQKTHHSLGISVRINRSEAHIQKCSLQCLYIVNLQQQKKVFSTVPVQNRSEAHIKKCSLQCLYTVK